MGQCVEAKGWGQREALKARFILLLAWCTLRWNDYMMEWKLVTFGASRPCARCKQDSGDQASLVLWRITTQLAWRFRTGKRSAQDSAHVLSQAQGVLFWLCLFVTERILTETEKNARDVKPFYLFVFFFSSLENYFWFRTTNVKGKTDHSVSLRKRRVFFWLCIRLICELISPSFAGLN